MAVGINTGVKYVFIGGPREGRTMSSAAGFSATAPGYYATGLAIPNDVGQDGTRAVLNDPTDADYVGSVSDLTGLDGIEIRESFVENVEDDGGSHGDFYAGRRPITVMAQIGGNISVTTRNQRQQRWINATSRALRGPATLPVGPLNVANRPGVMIWTPTGYPEMFLRYRTQQATRISGQWMKDGGAALIADDPRIYSTAVTTASFVPSGITSGAGTTYNRSGVVNSVWTTSGRGDITATNAGDAEVGAVITVHGPVNTWAVQNVTTAEELAFTGVIPTAVDTMIIDLQAKSITIAGVGTYGGLSIPRSRWFKLQPGANTIRFINASGLTGSSNFAISYRSGWM